MSEENGQQEPSMEEILASIRKIISEDEEQEKTGEGVTNSDTPELESPSISEPVLEPDPEPVSEPEPETVTDTSAELEEEEEFELIEEEEDVGIEPIDGDDEELELKPEWAETIVSDPTTQAGVDSFGQLAGIIAGRMQLGQGRTVEELVQELLKPLLREWLDKNLPELVEELVKKEIERMVEKANR
jgi:cell pole-organizing protein PopZ